MKSPATHIRDAGDFVLAYPSRELLETAFAAAEASGSFILSHFRKESGLRADDKGLGGKFDPVTIADRGAEEAIRAVLAQQRPDDGIIGEEFGAKDGQSGLNWVLDPIDGTRAFIAGAPVWGTLIAVCDGTRPILGVIDQPYTGERFVGGFGEAQNWRNGASTKLATRACADLEHATLLTTHPEIGTDAERLAFEAVRDRVKLTRYGLDCYGYALLASGCVDILIEAGLENYDVAAPIAVIEAAGGQVTDWQGRSADEGGQILATGDPRIHDAALALLNA